MCGNIGLSKFGVAIACGVKPRCFGGGVDGGSIWPLGGKAAGVGEDFM